MLIIFVIFLKITEFVNLKLLVWYRKTVQCNCKEYSLILRLSRIAVENNKLSRRDKRVAFYELCNGTRQSKGGQNIVVVSIILVEKALNRGSHLSRIPVPVIKFVFMNVLQMRSKNNAS